jgi:DNA-binding NtrC family response regulator
MPALRERLEEVPPLAEHFLNALSATMNSPPKKLSEEALACLSAYNWPGNVRQLRNAVEYAVVLSKGQLIGADGLPEEVRNSSRSTEVTSSTHVIPPTSPVAIIEPAHFATPLPATQMPNGLRDSVREAEIQLIRTTLEKNRWQISKVAKELKISRSTLYQRMKEYGVTR